MSFSRFTGDMNIISSLQDKPNEPPDSYSAGKLKAAFDEGPNRIKDYLNNALLPELEGDGAASNIGVNSPVGDLEAGNVQEALGALFDKAESSGESAEANAKSYADGLKAASDAALEAAKTELEGDIADAKSDVESQIRSTAADLSEDIELVRNETAHMVSTPLVASRAADMADTSKVYVYAGSTGGGLTNGHWYYWDGSDWTDGGVYNSTAFTTDTTLSIAGAAADAKATGDTADELQSAFVNNYDGLINTKEYVVRIPNSFETFYTSSRASSVGLYNNILTLTWTAGTASANHRVGVTGTPSTVSTSAPNYRTRPEWFVDDIPDFVVGHRYYFDVKLLSGEMTDGASIKNFVLFTKDGSLNNKAVNLRSLWACNIKPQSISLNFAPGQYDHCVFYVSITDKTLEALNTENADRLASVSTEDKSIAEIKNITAPLMLQKFSLNLPLSLSNYNTPSLANIVDFTVYDAVSAFLGQTYGTPQITKSIVLSGAGGTLLAGDVDFVGGAITKTYDYLILDGVTDGLKFTQNSGGTQYIINNVKLSACLNSYRCFSSWLPEWVLRVNKSNHYVYGYASDFAALGFDSVEALNEQIQALPLYVVFKLQTPVTTNFQGSEIYISNNMVAWSNIGNVSVEYPSDFSNSVQSVVDKTSYTEYQGDSNVSCAPTYRIPSKLYYNNPPYFYDIIGDVRVVGDTCYRTNGAGYDGKRYLYYCMGYDSTHYAIRKFDTWKKEVVATRPASDIGHCETITFVPSWCKGFDNGTVDRIYSSTLDSDGTFDVFSADTLELLTSFTTNDLIASEYFGRVYRMAFNASRGKFVLHGNRITIDGTTYCTLSIASADGEIEKCVRSQDAGTGCGVDTDDNFIYLAKDVDSDEDYILVIDWNLSPVTMATFEHYDWEPEALFHIGNTFYITSNIENSGGVNIWEYPCVSTFIDSPSFPLSGWDNSIIDSSSFVEIPLS